MAVSKGVLPLSGSLHILVPDSYPGLMLPSHCLELVESFVTDPIDTEAVQTDRHSRSMAELHR